MKTVNATRYVTPLREGGSLPAIVEADDGQSYVMKFLGAGHGRKALIAELIAGEIGRLLGMRIPELAFIHLDPELGPSEPDPEIFDLLRMSVGLNLGLRYLPKAFNYTALSQPSPSAELASTVVWFDAYVTNVDRTPRNTNILIWEKELWFIDHGSALYFHHDWNNYLERSRTPFPQIQDHTLLSFATGLAKADAQARARVTPTEIDRVVGLVPDPWLEDASPFSNPADHRAAYAAFLKTRLGASSLFVQEAENARAARV